MTDKETADIEAGATRPTNFIRQIIENKFGTKVDINAHKIVISYKDVKDLNRILEIMDCLEKE